MSPLPDLTFVDQHGGRRHLVSLRGRPAVLVHAGRAAAATAADVGRCLHARLIGESSCVDVPVIPVIDLAEVPVFFHGMARTAVRNRAGGVTIWIDFAGGLRRTLSLDVALAHVVVIDAAGAVARVENGPFTPDWLVSIATFIAGLPVEADRAGVR